MSVLVILLLAALWAAILLPGAVRAHRDRHPVASVDGFSRSMTTLAARQTGRWTRREPRAGRTVLVPRRPLGTAPPKSAAIRRRRRVLAGLCLVFLASLLAAGVAGGAVWVLAGGSAAVLAGYVGLLAALAARSGRPLPGRSQAAVAADGEAPGWRSPVPDVDDEPVVALSAPALVEVPRAAEVEMDLVVADVRSDAGLVSVRTIPRASG